MSELLKRRKRVTEPEAQYYMMQILEGTRYLHKNGIIHRDLKLGNLFIAKNMDVKIGDFGLATQLTHINERKRTICGTPNYIAPEILEGKSGHSFQVDIWSIGVILYTLLVGKPPYETNDVKATYKRIRNNIYSFPDTVQVSSQAKFLIQRILQLIPEQRPSIEEIMAHPFFTRPGQTIPRTLPSAALTSVPAFDLTTGDCQARESRRPLGERHNNTQHDHRMAGKSGTGYTRASATLSSKQASVPGDNAHIHTTASNNNENAAPAYGHQHPNTARDHHAAPTYNKADIRPQSARVPSSTNYQQPASTYHQPANVPAAAPAQERRGPAMIAFEENRGSAAAPAAYSSAHSAAAPAAYAAAPPRTEVHQPEPMHVSPKATPDAAMQTDTPKTTRSQVSSTPTAMPISTELATKPAASPTDPNANTLENMHQQLLMGFASADNGAAASAATGALQSLPGDYAPMLCVNKWVDYTSKYGLGYLFSDGSSGVYFNDSSKIILSANGQNLEYMERVSRRSNNGVVPEPRRDCFTLDNYSPDLQKKVTLLKHFRNYLVEQQAKSGEPLLNDPTAPAREMVYLKKWVKTRHAVLFRLSNRTVQVNFFDHTEILLSSEARLVTYVDRQKVRTTYHLKTIMDQPRTDIAKRLKYTKDILHQLISGARH